MTPGTRQVLLPALRGALLAAVFIASNMTVNRTVQAATDDRVAAQAAYIKQLENLLAKCLTRGDHPIRIGDEIWFCGSSNTGLKTK